MSEMTTGVDAKKAEPAKGPEPKRSRTRTQIRGFGSGSDLFCYIKLTFGLVSVISGISLMQGEVIYL